MGTFRCHNRDVVMIIIVNTQLSTLQLVSFPDCLAEGLETRVHSNAKLAPSSLHHPLAGLVPELPPDFSTTDKSGLGMRP